MPTPPVPLKPRLLPEIEMELKTSFVFKATKITPAVLRLLVFQTRPNGRAGKMTELNTPLAVVLAHPQVVIPGHFPAEMFRVRVVKDFGKKPMNSQKSSPVKAGQTMPGNYF